jgi:voltage-gated potassium channel
VDVRGPAPGDQEPSAVSADGVGATGIRLERSALLLTLLRTVLTGVVVLVLYYVLPLNGGAAVRTVLTLVAGLVAIGVLVAWQVHAILRSGHPALRAVEAIALSLPLFLLLFAAAYFVLASQEPGSFSEPLSRTDCIYFVVTVFATVGFGDIHPVSEVARLLTTVQMVGDLILIGLVLRLFVAAVDRGRRRVAGDEPRVTP